MQECVSCLRSTSAIWRPADSLAWSCCCLFCRDIHEAMRTLTDPDPHMRDAVEARQEIDLRIGAAFTRWQTDRLRKKFPGIEEVKQVVSYGQTDGAVSNFSVCAEVKAAGRADARTLLYACLALPSQAPANFRRSDSWSTDISSASDSCRRDSGPSRWKSNTTMVECSCTRWWLEK